MRYLHARLLSGAAVWLALGFVLASRGHPGLAATGDDMPVVAQVQGRDALATREQGQDALATPEVLPEPIAPGNGLGQPMIAVKRQGRVLVLTYGLKSAGGGGRANPDPHGEPPGFVVYRGQRPIATGKFEFG